MADDDDTGQHGGGRPSKTTIREKIRSRFRGPTTSYAQAEQQPADQPQGDADFGTGPGVPSQYHYDLADNYHHQYANDSAAAMEGAENNPT